MTYHSYRLTTLKLKTEPGDGGCVLTCVLRGEPDALLKAAACYRVRGWKASDRELEDLFLDFYREAEDPTSAHDA